MTTVVHDFIFTSGMNNRLATLSPDNASQTKGDYQAAEMPAAESAELNTAFEGYQRILTKLITPTGVDAEKLARLLNTGDTDALMAELDQTHAKREKAAREVEFRASMLDSILEEYPQLKEKANEGENVINGERFRKSYSDAMPRSLSEYAGIGAMTTAPSDMFSSKEINDMLAKAISDMSDDYLGVFQQAVEKNAAFFKDFSDFISKLNSFISADGDNTLLNSKDFNDALDNIIKKYQSAEKKPTSAAVLFPVQTGTRIIGTSQADCESWAREMGLNIANSVTRLADGSFVVNIDLTPLNNIRDSVSGDEMKFNAAQWSAWQTGLDMQKDNIQTAMQTLTQKYSNAHSTFDNLVKVLSSTIASLLDCDKQFLV